MWWVVDKKCKQKLNATEDLSRRQNEAQQKRMLAGHILTSLDGPFACVIILFDGMRGDSSLEYAPTPPRLHNQSR